MSNNYTVLARKYRPKSFNEIIGQDVFVTILRNTFIQKRVGHAFLLHGTRGIGKTTTARIIALALNCEKGISADPCGHCKQCDSIIHNRNQDVIEVDAASNNGVDDIRELINNIRYTPFSAQYKVYIIDEVHMLSISAFNALLKTLEEPPSHVKFIFATTEIKKIPNTIISRCQKFDLQRVELKQLISYYKQIANQEGFTVEDEAIRIIAIAAAGSVRDGLSILDQALNATTEDKILTSQQIEKILGLVNWATVYQIITSIIQCDLQSALTLIRESYDKGASLPNLLEELMNVVYRAAIYKATNKEDDFISNTEQMRLTESIAKQCQVSMLSRIWIMLEKGYEELKHSPLPLYSLEMLIMRIVYTHSLPSIESLLEVHQ